jgi:hypothetical protein
MQMFIEDLPRPVHVGYSLTVVAGIARGDWKSLTFDTPMEVNALITRIHRKTEKE